MSIQIIAPSEVRARREHARWLRPCDARRRCTSSHACLYWLGLRAENATLRDERDEHMRQLCYESTLEVSTTEREEAEHRWGPGVAQRLYPEPPPSEGGLTITRSQADAMGVCSDCGNLDCSGGAL